MKKTLLKVLSFCVLASASVRAEVPADWLDQAKKLVAATAGMSTQLSDDAVLYAKMTTDINNVYPLMDAANKLRDEAMSCVKQTVSGLASDLAKCKADTAAIVEQGNIDINQLLGRIADLKANTDAEIARLKDKKTGLQSELDQLRIDYAAATGAYKAEADKIFLALNDVVVSLDKAIAERKVLSDKITEFFRKVNSDALEDKVGIQELAAEICG